jgi:hypothetical protein
MARDQRDGNMKRRLLAAASLAAALVAIGVPAGAQLVPLLGPVPVTDPMAEPTWIQTLVQGISTATSLKNIVHSELENLIPTEFRWAFNTTNPQAVMGPIFATGTHELAVYQAQVEANTGAPPPPDEALVMAQTGMEHIPQDEDDLANAQTASDACGGNLCVQQAGHRFQQLQLTNGIEQRQFEYTRYQQQVKGETAASAWATTPQTDGAQ